MPCGNWAKCLEAHGSAVLEVRHAALYAARHRGIFGMPRCRTCMPHGNRDLGGPHASPDHAEPSTHLVDCGVSGRLQYRYRAIVDRPSLIWIRRNVAQEAFQPRCQDLEEESVRRRCLGPLHLRDAARWNQRVQVAVLKTASKHVPSPSSTPDRPSNCKANDGTMTI